MCKYSERATTISQESVYDGSGVDLRNSQTPGCRAQEYFSGTRFTHIRAPLAHKKTNTLNRTRKDKTKLEQSYPDGRKEVRVLVKSETWSKEKARKHLSALKKKSSGKRHTYKCCIIKEDRKIHNLHLWGHSALSWSSTLMKDKDSVNKDIVLTKESISEFGENKKRKADTVLGICRPWVLGGFLFVMFGHFVLIRRVETGQLLFSCSMHPCNKATLFCRNKENSWERCVLIWQAALVHNRWWTLFFPLVRFTLWFLQVDYNL